MAKSSKGINNSESLTLAWLHFSPAWALLMFGPDFLGTYEQIKQTHGVYGLWNFE